MHPGKTLACCGGSETCTEKSFYRASIFIDGIAKVNVVFSGVEFTLRIPPWALAISDAI